MPILFRRSWWCRGKGERTLFAKWLVASKSLTATSAPGAFDTINRHLACEIGGLCLYSQAGCLCHFQRTCSISPISQRTTRRSSLQRFQRSTTNIQRPTTKVCKGKRFNTGFTHFYTRKPNLKRTLKRLLKPSHLTVNLIICKTL